MSVPPTERELEALKILWARGKATVREVYQDFRPRSDREGELAYTTVLSLLQTMEQKGLVDHEVDGKAYRYFARARKERVFRTLARGFVERVFDGALDEFVARAIQSRKPSVQELEELERVIQEAKAAAHQREEGGA